MLRLSLGFRVVVLIVLWLLSATTNPAKKKGRELNAPLIEAPRSARPEKHAKPRPMGAYSAAGPLDKKFAFFR